MKQIISFKVFKESGKWAFDLPDLSFDYDAYVDTYDIAEKLVDEHNLLNKGYKYILIENSKYELFNIYNIYDWYRKRGNYVRI